MNRFLYFILYVIIGCLVSSVNVDKTPQQKYIDRYAAIAVEEMYRTGVPASITLAQGLLESGCGLSALALKGNNHFGIKCHDWTGRKVYYNDDRMNECFRAYNSAEESFRDHSDFLRYRDRYKFLFDYSTTDYKSWAYGLKKAGYATDPKYSQKLIKYIEDWNLSKYDKMTFAQAEKITGEVEKKEGIKNKYKIRAKDVPDRIPESPLKIEAPKRYDRSYSEVFRFNLNRQMYSRNGVPYITAVEGETIYSIAKDYDLFPKEIIKYNDLNPNDEILPGDIVYLQPKKKYASGGLEKYIVDKDGESLRQISQRFGVRLSTILKLNNINSDYQTKEGDCLLMRKKSFFAWN